MEKGGHKDKERLRHHKQIKLLNEVLEIVPRSPFTRSQTRIRKLRHLVLYYHFLKMIHAQIAAGRSSISKANASKKYVKKKAKESGYELRKIPCETMKKQRRANIVFLQADKSANQKKNILQKSVGKHDSMEVCCNHQESPTATTSEYQLPETVLINGRIDNICCDQEITSPLENPNPYRINIHNSSSSQYEITPASTSINHIEKLYCDLGSNISSEDLLCNEKENCSPFSANIIINSREKDIERSVFDIENLPQSIVTKDQRLISTNEITDCRNVSQNSSDSFIFKNVAVSSAANECFQVSSTNIPKFSEEHALNSFENYSHPSANILSGDYQKASLSSDCTSPDDFTSDCFMNSACFEPRLYNWLSMNSIDESIPDYSSSSTLSDKLNIDLENLSDSSNPSCTNIPDNCNPVINSANCSHIYPICDNAHSVPIATSYEELDNNCIIPMFSSNSNYFGSSILQNDVLFTPVDDISNPYFGNAYSTTISSTFAHPLEYVPLFQGNLFRSEFMNDNESFYSPSINENIQSEEFPVQIKSELMNSDDFPESFSQGNTSAFFDEETSYSLSQYINN